MISECKIALIQSWIGVAVMVVSMIIVLLGKKEYFGYLEAHVLGISVLALLLLIFGAFLSASYMRCIMSQGKTK